MTESVFLAEGFLTQAAGFPIRDDLLPSLSFCRPGVHCFSSDFKDRGKVAWRLAGIVERLRLMRCRKMMWSESGELYGKA